MSDNPTSKKPRTRGTKQSQSAAGARTPKKTAGSAALGKGAQSGAQPGVPAVPKMRGRGRIVAAIVGAVVLVGLIAGGLFAWDRWARYDDAADIQGVWLDEATGAQMAINEERMLLGGKLDYSYTIDPKEKTVSFHYEGDEGHASYRFSGDRQTLVFDESGKTDWLVALHLKEDPAMSGDVPKGCTRLVRQKGYAQDEFSAYDIAQAEKGSDSTTSVVGRLPQYDSASGTFYDAATGYVYDPASGLFMDSATGMGYTPSELGYDEQAMINGLASGTLGFEANANGDMAGGQGNQGNQEAQGAQGAQGAQDASGTAGAASGASDAGSTW